MLSDLQTRKLTRYFQVYDIDDDGRIEEADFRRIIENVRVLHGESGNGPSRLGRAYEELWQRLVGADGNRDGGVDIDEWLAYWQLTLESDERYESEVNELADRLFSVFDLDEDGALGMGEFADFHGVFGLPVSLAEAVFRTLDTDEDGAITRAELLEATREFFRSDDVEAAGNVLFGPYGA